MPNFWSDSRWFNDILFTVAALVSLISLVVIAEALRAAYNAHRAKKSNTPAAQRVGFAHVGHVGFAPTVVVKTVPDNTLELQTDGHVRFDTRQLEGPNKNGMVHTLVAGDTFRLRFDRPSDTTQVKEVRSAADEIGLDGIDVERLMERIKHNATEEKVEKPSL